MKLEKYSFGHGDRFGQQGRAQLSAVMQAQAGGIPIVPVWNKSNREHTIIGTMPMDTRSEADQAVEACAYTGRYYVDADHINLTNVAGFMEASDFFTIDVAETIGKPCDPGDMAVFVKSCSPYIGTLSIPGISQSIQVNPEKVKAAASQFLSAVKEAGAIYRTIAEQKGAGNFITEVSMDETEGPQSPTELFFILAALAQEGVPVQTIAPKFSGRFNKGVDYVGDAAQFEEEFRQDVAVIEYAKTLFDLPATLKLSVHSGSDKFSIYGAMNRALKEFNAGVHVKTAGTTWLEELIGLAEADGDGLVLAKTIYARAFAKSEALCAPYATVIDIDAGCLPSPEEVNTWTAQQYVEALRHDLKNPNYNLHLRQLLHVGYKIAADLGRAYLDGLKQHETIVARNVSGNILKRHIEPIFEGL
ncbi:MAG: tagaturonate epimerase family protein [Phycisphaerae bacterium]|nr:tagaturonate epimerase family protein [Phycisphaerae bacterium]